MWVYSRHCPYFEANIKPLRKVQRGYHQKPISLIFWTSKLISLFDACKANFVTSPLLLRYDGSKSAFLDIDWSADGIGYILTQHDESPQSLAAIKLLETTRKYTFDLTLDRPQIQSLFFGSRTNHYYEKYDNSFIDEDSCRR